MFRMFNKWGGVKVIFSLFLPSKKNSGFLCVRHLCAYTAKAVLCGGAVVTAALKNGNWHIPPDDGGIWEFIVKWKVKILAPLCLRGEKVENNYGFHEQKVETERKMVDSVVDGAVPAVGMGQRF